MRIRIRAKRCRLFLPVPLGLAGFAIKLIPNRVFVGIQESTPEGCRPLVTKESIMFLAGECLDALKASKGLEVVHVEAADGAFVSIKI